MTLNVRMASFRVGHMYILTFFMEYDGIGDDNDIFKRTAAIRVKSMCDFPLWFNRINI